MSHLARLAIRAADALGCHATDLEWEQAGAHMPASVVLSRAKAMQALGELFAVLRATEEHKTGPLAVVVEAVQRRGNAICVGAIPTEELSVCASLLREAAEQMGVVPGLERKAS